MLNIRPATDVDRDAIWEIFHEVVAAGDAYAIDSDISRENALAYWFRPDTRTYIAKLDCLKQSSSRGDGRVAGTYILRPNQSGGGAHVANAAFMVATWARGQGIGRAMGEHCLNEARRFGFRGSNLTLSFPRTNRRFGSGSGLVSKSSARYLARSNIQPRDMSTFT